jgi:hypothetical protein
VLRRRFRALVGAHCWRAATLRHFPVVAAAMAAAAARAAGAAATTAAASAAPTAAEWKAAYKLLTLVPWPTFWGRYWTNLTRDTLAPMYSSTCARAHAMRFRFACRVCTALRLVAHPCPL